MQGNDLDTPTRRFQSIVTAEIRRLDALHVDVRVSRQRPSVLLLKAEAKCSLLVTGNESR